MPKTGLLQRFPETEAGGFTRVDGTIAFYQRVNALLKHDMHLLDFGAGRGEWQQDSVSYRRSLRMFKGKVDRVTGVDVDIAVRANNSLDRAIVLEKGVIPLASGSVDIIIADHVLEHVAEPQSVVIELSRVLAPGGWICARTPNRYGYVAIANRVLPERLRRSMLRIAQPDRQDEDVFEAYYQLNTARALRRWFSECDVTCIMWNAEPAYAGNSDVMFAAMDLMHRITPNRFALEIFAYMRKRPYR